MNSAPTKLRFDEALLSREYLADPYPFYSELRNREPLYFSQKLNGWVVTRYSDVAAGLLDKRLLSGHRVRSFSSSLRSSVQDQLCPLHDHLEKWIGNMDPPDHTRLRALVSKTFTPRMVQDLADSIRAIATRLLYDCRANGRMEFVHDFAYPLPATVISVMLGVPTDDQERFIAWAGDLTAYMGSGSPDLELSRAALRSVIELSEYFEQLTKDRLVHPRNDLISTLVLEGTGEKLTSQEQIAMCTFLLVAGHETTMGLLSNGLLALLRNPSQHRALEESSQLAARAVEEFLRYDSPIQHQTRVAKQDFDFAGTKIKEGQRVLLMLGAANRDPVQFPEPDRLDILREPNKHLAFGLGSHYCLGAPLARLEAQIAFPEILRHLPGLRLEDEELEWRFHTSNRNPSRMRVTWE